MKRTRMSALFGLLALGILVPHAGLAVTRQEYTEASARWLDTTVRRKTMSVVKKVLEQPLPRPPGLKQAVYGRGEVVPVRPLANLGASLLVMGRESEAKSYFDDVRLIFAAATRAVLDGYDDPVPELNGSTDQVSFALPELVRAYQVMVDLHQFNENDHERARLMLLRCAEFRFKKMPVAGEGNLGTRYCLGPVMLANAFEAEGNKDESVANKNQALAATFDTWRKWAAGSFRSMIYYGWKDGAPTGRLKMLEKAGNNWNRVDAPLPSTPRPGLGFCEDSSGYGAATVINFLLLIEAIPPAYMPELRNPAAWQEIHGLIDGYRQLFMPIGIIPNFGDATWGSSSGTWVCLYELAAKTFQDRTRWGNSAAIFRDTADRLFHYHATNCYGMFGEDLDQAIEYMMENIPTEPSIPRSFLLTRQSVAGCRVPYKIVLRGDATPANRQEQPYALVNVSPGESHCHGDVGCLAAYGVGGSVLTHEAGYDAGPAFFHDQFMVRPASEPFLPFTKVFTDPKGTLLDKIDANHKRLGDVTLGRDSRTVRGAAMQETKYVSWGMVATDYTLEGGYGLDYKNKYLVHTRQVALLRATGNLVVFDTIEAREAIKGLNVGPIWHVHHVLAKDTNRFLCQEEEQAILEPNGEKPTVISSPARPMVVAMTGPPATVVNNLPYRFLMRRGREAVTSENHLTTSAQCDLAEGDRLSFLTVLSPQQPGSSSLPPNLTQAHVTASAGSLRIDNLVLTFSTNSTAKPLVGARQPLLTVSNGRYSASIIENGKGQTQVQETR